MLRGKMRLNQVRLVHELRLSDLNQLETDIVTLDTLKLAKIVPENTQKVKLIAYGKLNRPLVLRNIQTTKKAQKLIEAAGGKVELVNKTNKA